LSFGVVIPEYNECSKLGKNAFLDQIRHIEKLSSSCKEISEIILVDDCSTDGGWELMANIVANQKLRVLRMDKNQRKIGAIKKVLPEITSEFVLLTDFDSQPVDITKVTDVLEKFREDEKLAAVALRIVPSENSILGRLQDLDYSMASAVGATYLKDCKKLRCVGGAGGIWRVKILMEILNEHSGRHNGDDMETTAIGMRKGYNFTYAPEVLICTVTPHSIIGLWKQRRRWELGALETFAKEKRFYLRTVLNIKNRLGHATFLEWFNWATLPLFFVSVIYPVIRGSMFAPLCYYIEDLGTCGAMCLYGRKLIDKKTIQLILMLPLYHAVLCFPSKTWALLSYIRKLQGKKMNERIK
jgi:cellulose synthase/poly-beta-1,6-N-acetylglucosamine synthase-like glycosyltransferase